MSILDELSNRRLFVLYKLVPRENGKTDKIPIDPLSGEAINAQDPATHMLPAEAAMWAEQWGAGYGVGIVITRESGRFAIDFDQCVEPSGGWQPHVAAFLQWFPDAYVERSVSGTGGHIIGAYHGELPDHRTRNSDYRAECYTEARFIALGQHISGSVLTDCTGTLLRFLAAYFPPREETDGTVEWTDKPVAAWRGPADDTALLDRAMRSTSAQAAFGKGASFAALWTANVDVLSRAFPTQNGHDAWDRSGADIALANHLAFWTGNDCERMARLMWKCEGLQRDKWHRPDYFRGTILRACASQTQWYAEPAQSLPLSSAPPAETSSAQLSGTPDAVTGTTLTVEIVGAEPPPPPVTATTMANLTINGKGLAEASLPNLVKTLGSQTQTMVGFDEFRGCIMISRDGGANWMRLTDNDMTALREKLERELRYAAIGKDMMRDALALVADRLKFDSAMVWLDSLAWDGVPRVDRFMADYCGAADDEYAKAVSRYIWSGLASRIFEPGCQLDMVPTFFSRQQGLYKSSALKSLVPDPEFFTDGLDLSKDDDNFKRMLKGKLVSEIAEMVNVSTGSAEHIKRVITRTHEEWVEKWQTLPTRYARRGMLFATTNQEQHLPLDETGQRRWLPMEIGQILRELIKRDRNQLWAEGAHIYRMRKMLDLPGVEFEEAERLAKGRHSRHEQRDVWETVIGQWLITPTAAPNGEVVPAPCSRPFTAFEVLRDALLMNKERMDAKAEKRVARTLKQLGYESRNMRVDGMQAKRWVKTE
jgi:hypothetical protein